MTIGTLIAFTALQGQLFRPLMGLLNTGVQVVSSLALFQRVFEYLDLPVDIDEPTDPVDLDPSAVRGHVRFEHVGFSYDDADVPALGDVDLDVPAGTHAGAGRRDRLRQDDARLAGRPAARPHRRAR